MNWRLSTFAFLCLLCGAPQAAILETTAVCDEGNEPIQLAFGDHTVVCSIELATDLDNFEFQVADPNTVVRISILASSSDPRFFDPRIELRDPGLNLIVDQFCSTGNTFGGCSFTVEETLQPGTYLLAVSESGTNKTGAYQLQIERIPVSGSSPNLPYDFGRADSISPQTDVDFFTFPGVANSLVRLTMRASGSDPRFFGPRLEVRGPDLSLLDDQSCSTGNTFGGCTFSIDLNIATAGDYELAVSELGTNRSGQYELELQCLSANCPPSSTIVVSSILPASRSPVVGSIATVFASISNGGQATAAGCTISPTTSVPVDFAFQSTDSATNTLTGLANAPVDVPIGGSSSFILSLTPTAEIASTDVEFSFDCINADLAPTIIGVNTLLLSAANTPTSDVIALAGTLENNGIVDIAGNNGTGVFSVATTNVGSDGLITVVADTGGATIPVAITLCETNPTTGVCLDNVLPPTTTSVTTQIDAGATPTFAIFLQGSGNVDFDPANSRIFVRFKDAAGVTRGATSVAVQAL